ADATRRTPARAARPRPAAGGCSPRDRPPAGTSCRGPARRRRLHPVALDGDPVAGPGPGVEAHVHGAQLVEVPARLGVLADEERRRLAPRSQRGLVTPERASPLMLDAMPENVALPAAIVEEMCDVLLDAIARGGEAPDAASARLLSALFRQLAPRHALVERARALGVLVDDA